MVAGDDVSISNCIKRALFCFDENTKVQITSGETIPVSQLSKGRKILSKENDEKFYDEVTDCTKVEGKFQAVKLIFSNGKSITVTSNHLMIVFNENELEMVPAKDVQLRDKMRFKYGFSTVTTLSEVILDKKYHVNTKSGLFFANELLTTGLCENLPENLPEAAKNIVKKHMNTFLRQNVEIPNSLTLTVDQEPYMTISLKDCYC